MMRVFVEASFEWHLYVYPILRRLYVHFYFWESVTWLIEKNTDNPIIVGILFAQLFECILQRNKYANCKIIYN